MPRQQRSGALVAAILQAAARILEQRGLTGFTTNSVAERAGVSVGSLYQYFPNKEALLAALSRAWRQELQQVLSIALAPQQDDDLSALLRRVIAAVLRFQRRRPEFERQLDLAERQLPLDEEAAAFGQATAAALAGALRRHGLALEEAEAAWIARDLQAILRALIDADQARMLAAEARPEEEAFIMRALGATQGYLEAVTGLEAAIKPRRRSRAR